MGNCEGRPFYFPILSILSTIFWKHVNNKCGGDGRARQRRPEPGQQRPVLRPQRLPGQRQRVDQLQQRLHPHRQPCHFTPYNVPVTYGKDVPPVYGNSVLPINGKDVPPGYLFFFPLSFRQ